MICLSLIEILALFCGYCASWSTILWTLGAILFGYGCIPIIKLQMSGYKHPAAYPFFGTTFWIMVDGFQKCYQKWNLKYGQIYALAESQNIVLVVSDPVLLKEITVKSFSKFPNRRPFPLKNPYFNKALSILEDDEWRWVRKLILPTFTTSKMRHGMFSLILNCAKTLTRHMKEELNSIGKDAENSDIKRGRDESPLYVETKSWFGCYTMDVIASTAFGLDLDSYTDKNCDFVEHAKKVFDLEVVRPIFALTGLFPFLLPLINASGASVFNANSLQFFTDIVDQTVAQRRKLKINRNDYLQILMDSNDVYNQSHGKESNDTKTLKRGQLISSPQNDVLEESHLKRENDNDEMMTMHDSQEFGTKKLNLLAGLSHEEYMSNALLFFIAGYESTANALSWIVRTLAWYPEVQENMRAEIKQAIKEAKEKKRDENNDTDDPNDEDEEASYLTYDDLSNMKYMDQIVKEVLRLHPPVSFIDRVASEDYMLDGRVVKKGAILLIPIYALHRDPKIWREPDEFKPNRFSQEQSSNIDPFAYMPFGYGPRNCIGLRFALLEIKVALAYMLGSGIKFIRHPSDTFRDLTPDNTKFKKNGINYPKYGLKVGIERCT